MFRFLQHISPIRIASAVIIIVVAFAMYWRVTGRRRLDDITLPAGFTIAMYSENVPNARQMAWGDNGTVFVGSRRAGNVYAVVDRDGDNVAEETYAIASDLTLPSGIAFYDGALYVAAVSRVLRYDDIESRLTNPPQPVVIRDDLPAETHHGWKFIQFGPDGLLYIPMGAPCNTCDPSDGHGGTIADPEYGNDRACGEFTPPSQALGPHVAAIGMRFYVGDMFPARYRNHIFIAEHGSWNRSTPVGYRITVVRIENNRAVGYDVFAEGWLQGSRAWGRPADVLVMPDGALLVSDDRQGAIYRISYGEG